MIENLRLKENSWQTVNIESEIVMIGLSYDIGRWNECKHEKELKGRFRDG